MSSLKRIARVNEADIIHVYKCSLCSKVLQTQSLLEIHMEEHNNDLPYSCNLCQYKCRVKKYLSRHKRKVHTKANGPACAVCGKVFHFGSSLKNHMRVHTGERPYHCEVCSKSYSSKYCLSMHRLVHTNQKPYGCKFCDYACRDSSTLRKHEERHLGINKKFPCHKCKKAYQTKQKLRIHVDEVHYGLDVRRIACEHCARRFKTVSSKNTHVKTVHERSDRVQCEICDRFISKNNMTTHLKTHVDIRPYSCSFKNCIKQFKDRGTLKKHNLIHYPELYFQCDMCDSRFVRQVRLRDHKKWHTNNGYTCDYCGGSFKTKTYLQLHITRKHSKTTERYICDQCDSVHYSKQSIILHLRYGHGHRDERNCRICCVILQNNAALSEHYLRVHKVRYIVIKKEDEVKIKNEPEEYIPQEFDFDYEVQKTEMEDHEPTSIESVLEKCKDMVEVDISPNMIMPIESENALNGIQEPVMNESQTKDYTPEYVDTETTLAYSEKVLEEDLSRSISEGKSKQPESTFEEFFLKEIVDKSKRKKLSKEKVDKSKVVDVQKTIDKMIKDSRMQKAAVSLEEMRIIYNKRIEMANKSKEKKEPTQIKYFKKSQTTDVDTKENDKTSEKNNDDDEFSLHYDDTSETDNESNMNDTNDEVRTRTKRISKSTTKFVGEELEEVNKNGKLRFVGHECYVCLKVFKTKDDLKFHCKEHFDICNEKMLKKCPFCGYVTNLNIKRHIETIHKININYDSAHIAEKPNATGSKYVFAIDKDCELEIIPSISNLNKIAGMKIDEKRRKDNNTFLGKTKLVKKGGEWVIEKHAVGVNSDNLLPEFTDEDYKKLKLTGESYFDRLQQLGFMAKRRGAKMLYPCEGCEKICQSLPALKLHNRKHEENPKKFKPKVWVNRKIEYKTKNRKKFNRNRTTKKNKVTHPVPVITNNNRKKSNYILENRYAPPQPVKNNHKCDKGLIEFYKNNIRGKDIQFWQFLKIFNKINRENVNDFEDLINRDDVHFGVHSKDEFIESNSSRNISNTSTNIEPAMNSLNKSKTNLNKSSTIASKKSVANRNLDSCQNAVTNDNALGKNVNESTHVSNKLLTIEPVITDKLVVPNKKYKIRKTVSKKLNRVIMISKSENMRRNAIKNEMRQRLANNKL